MELSAFMSPLVLVVTSIITTFMSVLVALDARRSHDRKRLQGVINRYVAKKARKSFNVIIELNRSVEAILPLLDHLTRVDYDNFRVIVIVRHTAGKRALNELRRYQRANRDCLTMSVIKHRKGMDRTFTLTRYAKNELVLWLQRDEHLSAGFFHRISLEFLDTSLDAIAARQVAGLNDTLASASQGWNMIIRDIFASLNGKSSEPKVYRRTALLEDSVTTIRYAPHSAVTAPASQTHRRYDGMAAFGLLLLLAAVGTSAYLLIPRSWILVLLAAVGAVVASLTLHLTSFHYSAGNKFILFLFLPFWLVISPLTPVTRKVSTRRHRSTMKPSKARAFTLW